MPLRDRMTPCRKFSPVSRSSRNICKAHLETLTLNIMLNEISSDFDSTSQCSFMHLNFCKSVHTPVGMMMYSYPYSKMVWNQKSRRNSSGWTHQTCSASLLSKWSRSTTRCTISMLGNAEISFRETHGWTIINQTIDNQCNHAVIHMVCNQWNWMQFNNHNDNHLRRTGVSSNKTLHASHVESQDT